MARSWSFFLTYVGGMALAVACSTAQSDAGSGSAGATGNSPQTSSGGRSSGAGGSNAGSGGSKSQAGQAAAAAGRQSGSAGGDLVGSAGFSGVIPAGGAGGESEPSILPGACMSANGDTASDGRGLVVKLKANSNQSEEFPRGEVQISNGSSASVPLASLELRYYIESEYSREQTDQLLVVVDHAQKSGLVYTNIAHGLVITDVVPLEPWTSGADAFIRIGFVGGAGQDGLLLPGETVLVLFRVQPPDDTYYRVPRNQANDYSFGACPEFASSWSRLVLLRDGDVVSGELPPGLPVPGEGGAGGQGGGPGFVAEGGSGGVGGAD